MPAAASFAFYMALTFALPPIVFYTDCQFVVDTFALGRAHSSDPFFVLSALWRKIWAKIDDLGTGAVAAVLKVNTHARLKDVDEGRIAAWQRDCNVMAEKLAKEATKEHPIDQAVVDRSFGTRDLLRAVAKFIGRVVARVDDKTPKDTTADRRRKPRRRPDGLRVIKKVRVHTDMGTGVAQVNGRFRCFRCFRSAASIHALPGMPCDGDRDEHALYKVGDIFFCDRCGAYSCARSVLLRNPCRGGPEGRSTALGRLRKGRHPADNVLIGLPSSLPFLSKKAGPGTG